jgi:hypothetical protein
VLAHALPIRGLLPVVAVVAEDQPGVHSMA